MQDVIVIEAGRRERNYWLDLWRYRKVDGSNIWTHFCEQSAVSRKSLNAGRDRYRSWATRA
jgi:hypothetical protein